MQGGATTCTACAYNTFHPGGSTTCSSCPSTTFYAPVDGAGAAFTSSGMTLYTGSVGQEACVPKQSQLSPEAGQAYFAPDAAAAALFTTTSNVSDLDACITLTAATKGQAVMAQYSVAAKTCQTVALPLAAADAASGTQMLYKLPPSAIGSASSVQAKMMASGHYAHVDVTANAATWATAGTNLGTDARTFSRGAAAWDMGASNSGTTRAECRKKCDASNVCWGFLFNTANGGSCLYRGGVDALATRAFFALPDAADVTPAALATLKW